MRTGMVVMRPVRLWTGGTRFARGGLRTRVMIDHVMGEFQVSASG